jgi:hypothetical protein
MCHPEYKKTKEEGGGEEGEELPPALPDGIVGTKVFALLALLVHKTQVHTKVLALLALLVHKTQALTQVVPAAVLGRGVLEVDKKEAFTSNEGVGCRMTQVRLLPL